MNNKLIKYKKQSLWALYIYRKKLRKTNWNLFGSGSRTGSVIPEADPRIRIRIKMKRIRNTAYVYCWFEPTERYIIGGERIDILIVHRPPLNKIKFSLKAILSLFCVYKYVYYRIPRQVYSYVTCRCIQMCVLLLSYT